MQRMIRNIFVLFLLGTFTVASAQLPPEIRVDAYLLQAEQAIRNGDLHRAQAAIQNILRLQKEHELDLSDEFHFRYAKAADAVDLSDQALESVLKYLVASGREGQHYLEALELMNKIQDGASRHVAAAQLSSNIIADAYLLQAERDIRDGDHNRARDAVQNIRTLQEQHELDLSDEFHFRYAKAAASLDMPDQALESVVKYLTVSGREGQHYLEALELMNKVQWAVSCKGWDTEEYFKTATLEEVTACLDAGIDLKARNDSGLTPLHRAVKNTDNPDILKVLIDAGANPNVRDNNGKGKTPLELAKERNNWNAERVLRAAGARKSKEESGMGKTALALIGGAAITYAGKDAADQEAVAEAARQFMEGVLTEQPVGSGNTSLATTSSQTQGGQAQGTMQQALQNLENVCGEKYQGNFSDNDHYRFYCMAAFNDYCALKRAQSSETINKLRASLQQNCAVLKSVGADNKCSYCK